MLIFTTLIIPAGKESEGKNDLYVTSLQQKMNRGNVFAVESFYCVL